MKNRLEQEKKQRKNNMTKKKEKVVPYELIDNSKKQASDKPFSNLVGYEGQKEELELLLKWFKDYDYWKSKNVTIPKGVLLYGRPGNGKSLLMKEAIKYVSLPTLIFKGNDDNISAGLEETFQKAKEIGHSVVVIDELDLLIDKDSKVTRILQENLDGVDSSDDILVLTATNFLWMIPEALLRNGRLEKIINIPYPTGEEAVQLLKMHFSRFNVPLPKDFDENELRLTLSNISGAGIKTIANDVVLRNGLENITYEMIIDSIYRITNHVQDKNKKSLYASAVHEAGHAVMAARYSQFFDITRLDINQQGGKMCVKDKMEDYWPYDKVIADINVCYAGTIAERIICGLGSLGCDSDMQNARENVWKAINENALLSCSDTVPEVRPYGNTRLESEFKRKTNVKKADRILRKCEKETIRYLKKKKEIIIKVAEKLFEKKFLRTAEVLSIINGN